MAVGRFDDPTAMALLRDSECQAVDEVRAGVPPRGWADRIDFEMLRASAEVMVPRTIGIDDAVRARPTPQVVILGAGLDGRAWRMPELSTADVYEVDHPVSQRDKQDRIVSLPPLARSLRFVPVDLTRDDLDVGLTSAGHRPSLATTWVWEGVVPYLTRAEVDGTVRVMDERSAVGSRVIVNYQAPSWSATLGRTAVRAMAIVTRRSAPWAAGEPRRSSWTPNAMWELLAKYRFVVTSDDDLSTLADRLVIQVRNRRSLRAGRIAVADR
jgi:methyltransferase (TIGR00027 family)